MIKKCKVKLQCGDLIVVDFNGIDVQMTSKNICDEVYVAFSEDVYSLSTKEEYEKSLKQKSKKTENKNIEIDNGEIIG